MGLKHVQMKPLKNPSNFRKLSMGNWGKVGDPQVYAVLELDCENALRYIETMREKFDLKITINHLVGRIIALTLDRYPQLNGMIARSKIYLRDNVDIFFQVAMEGAETELVGICIKNAHEKGIAQFAESVLRKTEKVRASKNHPMRKSQARFGIIPWRLMPTLVKFLNWLQYDWNFNLSWLGIPKDAMGSLMVTSVGTLGMELVFVPLTHIGRTPGQIAIGSIHKKPVVNDNDQVEVRKRLNLCCTFDHRFMDGLLASKMAKMLTAIFENPQKYSDYIEAQLSGKEFKFRIEQ